MWWRIAAEALGEFRWRYLDYLMQGVDGDDAARMAREDCERIALERFIDQQPER